MLGNRDNIRACDFSNSDAAIGLVGCVKINVVRSNTSRDCKLELLGFRETICR
jgi:hypothetical protein